MSNYRSPGVGVSRRPFSPGLMDAWAMHWQKFYVITRAFRLPSGPGGWSHGCLKISRSVLLVRVWRPSFFVVLALSGANMHRHKSVGWQPSWPVNLITAALIEECSITVERTACSRIPAVNFGIPNSPHCAAFVESLPARRISVCWVFEAAFHFVSQRLPADRQSGQFL